MSLTDAELAECLRDPEQTYTQANRGDGDRMFQRGRLAVVVTGNRVKTILWRTHERYER